MIDTRAMRRCGISSRSVVTVAAVIAICPARQSAVMSASRTLSPSAADVRACRPGPYSILLPGPAPGIGGTARRPYPAHTRSGGGLGYESNSEVQQQYSNSRECGILRPPTCHDSATVGSGPNRNGGVDKDHNRSRYLLLYRT